MQPHETYQERKLPRTVVQTAWEKKAAAAAQAVQAAATSRMHPYV